MAFKLQIVIAIVLIMGLFAILNMIRKKSLELKYALSWIGVIFMLLVLVVFPGVMISLSRLLGIWSPVNMIFFLGFIFSLIIIFTLTVALSRTSERVRRLAQIIALNEEKQENVKNTILEETKENEENSSNGM